MQAKNKLKFSIFRFISYTVFLLILLLTDNVFNYSDSKILSMFILFSFSFEFVVSGMKTGCHKFWASILSIMIICTGIFLIEKAENKNSYEKSRIHFLTKEK